MAITDKGREVLRTHAKYRLRDKSGRFKKETQKQELVRKREVVREFLDRPRTFAEEIKKEQSRVKELSEKFKEVFAEYEYTVSADYKPQKPGRRGHEFNGEFKVTTGSPKSVDELAEMIKDAFQDDRLEKVLEVSEFKEKGFSVRSSNIPVTEKIIFVGRR